MGLTGAAGLVTVTVTTGLGLVADFDGVADVEGLALLDTDDVAVLLGAGCGGGGGTVAGMGEPSTLTEPSRLMRRKAGFGFGTKPN